MALRSERAKHAGAVPMPPGEVVTESVRASTAGRVVTVLEAVAHAEEGVGVRSLARETGIDRSAVSRLLRQLTELGLVMPAAVANRYLIGPRLYALAGAITSRDELRTAAKPYLEGVASRFNETA